MAVSVERTKKSSAGCAPQYSVSRYEATIEDPNVFTRPWKISMPLYRKVEPNAQLLDFKCPEFVEELLYGPQRRNSPSR